MLGSPLHYGCANKQFVGLSISFESWRLSTVSTTVEIVARGSVDRASAPTRPSIPPSRWSCRDHKGLFRFGIETHAKRLKSSELLALPEADDEHFVAVRVVGREIDL